MEEKISPVIYRLVFLQDLTKTFYRSKTGSNVSVCSDEIKGKTKTGLFLAVVVFLSFTQYFMPA